MSDSKAHNSEAGSTEQLAHGTLRAYFPVLAAIITSAGIAWGPGIIRSDKVDIGNHTLSPYEVEQLRKQIRNDPFTGKEGDALKSSVEALRAYVDINFSEIHRKVDKLPPRELTERLRILELRMDRDDKEMIDHERDIDRCCNGIN